MKRPATALVAAGLGVATVANAYRPLARSGPLSTLTWLSGLCGSELALPTAAVHLGIVTAAARGTRRYMRALAWLASGVSGAGMLNQYRIGRRADQVLAVALDEALGTDRPRDSAGVFVDAPREGAAAKSPGLMRTMRIHRHYAHDADIRYGPHGDANLLDIWRRPGTDPSMPRPVLLHIPGGAWASGNKQGQAHPLMSHLAELGWLCVSINYRLSPRHDWPTHLVDVKRAIAWVKQNIARFDGDPDFVALTGGSAGGHLTALAALTANDRRYQPGFGDADTTVNAAIPFYGVYDLTRTHAPLHPMMVPFLERTVMKRSSADDPDLFREASPLTHIRADAPPFFVLHGANDSFIPVKQARAFATRLREISCQPVAYAELPFAQHAFDIFSSPRATHAAVAVEQFLAKVYADRLLTQSGCDR